MFGPCFVIQYCVSFLFRNSLDGEERDACFTIIVFLVPCGCWWLVALPDSAEGLSAVCDSGIS